MLDFHGSKLAYIVDALLLVYRRDRKPDIPFPGLWDLPGGGREGDETPERCVLRELNEEFALRLTADRLLYRRDYSVPNRSRHSCFFVAHGTIEEVGSIVFGDEGEEWRLMSIHEFLGHEDAVPYLQARVSDYLLAR